VAAEGVPGATLAAVARPDGGGARTWGAPLPRPRREGSPWNDNAVVRSTLAGGEDCVSADVDGSSVHR